MAKKAREIREDRTQRADAIRPEAGSVRPEKKVFLLMSHHIQPCNFMNNSPLGINLIPLDSWHRAQEAPCAGFRIGCVAVVNCCYCDP